MTDERLGGRQPTSHERMSGRPWDASYRDGPAPWDVGVQPVVARLTSEGAFTGTVLDAGCGSGDNAVHLAGLGLSVLGVDVAGTALERAREKAARLGVPAEFEAADALHLERLGRTFRTVLDSGLFHTFDDGERRAYVASLASATEPGGRLVVLCFRETDSADAGPHPVSEATLRECFVPDAGWRIDALERVRVHTRFHGDDGAPGWLVTATRV